MDTKKTKLKLQEMAVKDNNALAGLMLNLIKGCSPDLQEVLLLQLSDSFQMLEHFEQKFNDPDFKEALMRRVQNGR